MGRHSAKNKSIATKFAASTVAVGAAAAIMAPNAAAAPDSDWDRLAPVSYTHLTLPTKA